MKSNYFSWLLNSPLIIIATASLLISCATNQGGLLRVQPRPGDPAIDGADYLISDQDFRALLAEANRKLAEIAPACTINRISVIDRDKVEAHFCEHDFTLHSAWRGTFTLKRMRDGWKVIDQRGGKPTKNERVII